jgi:hypothetical protein
MRQLLFCTPQEISGAVMSLKRRWLMKKAGQRSFTTPHPLTPSLREGENMLKGFALLIPQGGISAAAAPAYNFEGGFLPPAPTFEGVGDRKMDGTVKINGRTG